MSTNTLALVLGIVAGIANVLGGVMVLRAGISRDRLPYLVALGAGFLLAIALVEMVPESVEGDPQSAFYVLAGFALILFFERVVTEHLHTANEHGAGRDPHRSASLVAVSLGMLLHTFFDGVSIGAGFQLGVRFGLLIFSAVLLHKLPDGFILASILLSQGRSRRSVLLSTAALGISTVAGASLSGLMAGGSGRFTDVALALSAGVFIYVAAVELIPEANRAEDRRVSLFVLLGMLLFYITVQIVSRSGLK